MKTIDAQGAVPTMADNLVVYRAEIDNTGGALGDGTSNLVPITTEIRQLLVVKAQVFQGSDRTPAFSDRKFDANFKVTDSSSGCKIVTMEVPSGCFCNYEISGDKGISDLNHPEQGEGEGSADPQHAGGHRHDGNDSHKVLGVNLDVASGQASKILKVNAGSTGFELVANPADSAKKFVQLVYWIEEGDITALSGNVWLKPGKKVGLGPVGDGAFVIDKIVVGTHTYTALKDNIVTTQVDLAKVAWFNGVQEKSIAIRFYDDGLADGQFELYVNDEFNETFTLAQTILTESTNTPNDGALIKPNPVTLYSDCVVILHGYSNIKLI